MNIYNPFKEKNLCMDDMKHNITGRMQDLIPLATLQQANAEKLEKAKELLGIKYILHPIHFVTRKEKLCQ